MTVLPEWHLTGMRTIEVPVYIDSEGWVVAYVSRDLRAWALADLMVWTVIDQENPQLDAIQTTSLEEAINCVLAAAGIDFAPLRSQVAYYDFEFPEAKRILLVARVEKAQADVPIKMQLTIAQGAKVYRGAISGVGEIDLRFSPHWYYDLNTGGGCSCQPSVSHFPLGFSRADFFPVGPVWTCGFLDDILGDAVVGFAVVIVYSTP